LLKKRHSQKLKNAINICRELHVLNFCNFLDVMFIPEGNVYL